MSFFCIACVSVSVVSVGVVSFQVWGYRVVSVRASVREQFLFCIRNGTVSIFDFYTSWCRTGGRCASPSLFAGCGSVFVFSVVVIVIF